MKRALITTVLLLAACASTPTPPPGLHDELIAMRDADQAIRKRALADRDNKALTEEWKATDAKNLARVKEIFAKYGWPTLAMVGKDGVSAMWILSQHGDAEFLHRVLPSMEKAVRKGELAGGLYATSFDRVRVQDKKKQLYGSQFDTNDGKCEPLPIEDPEHVDQRRKEIGLGPLSEYAEQLCALYKGKK